MPPRYAYWTIIAGGLPTAFRAADREELLPTFQRIKEKHPKLPIILATGYAELPALRPIEFGHLSKPYTSKDLASALEKAVN